MRLSTLLLAIFMPLLLVAAAAGGLLYWKRSKTPDVKKTQVPTLPPPATAPPPAPMPAPAPAPAPAATKSTGQEALQLLNGLVAIAGQASAIYSNFRGDD